jgi:hypothetical protein
MATGIDTSEHATGGPATTGAPDDSARLNARLALWAFVGFVVVAFFAVLFKLGSYHWFFNDDFVFLTERNAGSAHDLFRDHNTHWSTVPVLAFRALWTIFGLRSYAPYQSTVLLLHLSACVLLRVIMRRAGASPWIATAAASAFVLFGAGYQNIIWAFQIGFTASLVFGLAQLVLADHDGPVDWRDLLGLVAGLLSLMSSGVGITMAIVAGLATLMRRGWKVASLQTAFLAAAYLTWSLAVRPDYSSPYGRPPVGAVFRWVRSSEIGTWVALGHFDVVAVALAVVLAVGLVLMLARADGIRALLARVAGPVALLVGGVAFPVMAVQGRRWSDPDFARSSRYLHLGAAFALPILAVAATAIARQWRLVTPVLVALFLVAVPWNLDEFKQDVYGPSFMARRKAILTNIVRLPEARQVPRDVRPIPDPRLSPNLNIGFLLDAEDAGKLPDRSGPMSSEFENELRLRLGVAQRNRPLPTEVDEAVRALLAGTPQVPETVRCQVIQQAVDLSPERGTEWWIIQPVSIATREGSQTTSERVEFDPKSGRALTVELDDLDLRLEPAEGADHSLVCELVR